MTTTPALDEQLPAVAAAAAEVDALLAGHHAQRRLDLGEHVGRLDPPHVRLEHGALDLGHVQEVPEHLLEAAEVAVDDPQAPVALLGVLPVDLAARQCSDRTVRELAHRLSSS